MCLAIQLHAAHSHCHEISKKTPIVKCFDFNNGCSAREAHRNKMTQLLPGIKDFFFSQKLSISKNWHLFPTELIPPVCYTHDCGLWLGINHLAGRHIYIYIITVRAEHINSPE